MSNKRIIWLTLSLILCVVGGGLYYALFSARLPFNISCPGGDTLTYLRFLVNRDRIVSKILQFVERKGEDDVTKWDRVEVYYSFERWFCYVYQEDKDLSSLCVEIDENGETKKTVTEKSLSDLIVKQRREEIRRTKHLNRLIEKYEELHNEVDFLIQPLIW